MFLLFIIPLWLQHASTEVLLHTFNTEGQWSAQKIFCHYHVSFAGNGAWEADWQQTAVVQISCDGFAFSYFRKGISFNV